MGGGDSSSPKSGPGVLLPLLILGAPAPRPPEWRREPPKVGRFGRIPIGKASKSVRRAAEGRPGGRSTRKYEETVPGKTWKGAELGGSKPDWKVPPQHAPGDRASRAIPRSAGLALTMKPRSLDVGTCDTRTPTCDIPAENGLGIDLSTSQPIQFPATFRPATIFLGDAESMFHQAPGPSELHTNLFPHKANPPPHIP